MDHGTDSLGRSRVALIVASACLVAVAVALLLVWQERRVEQREASVRHALPVIEAAIHAALANDAQARITEELQRGSRGDADAYRQFIVVDSPGALRSFRWGQDFTWRGKHYGWPTNPFTGRPMQAGTGPGDVSIRFIYYGLPSGVPDGFELTAHGAGGKPVATVTAKPAPMPVQP